MINARQFEMSIQLKLLAEQCGFYLSTRNDHLALHPNTDKLPVYGKNVTIAIGSVEELTTFLCGWLKHREYIVALGATKHQTIERKEQDVRNKRLMKMIKDTGADYDEVPF